MEKQKYFSVEENILPLLDKQSARYKRIYKSWNENLFSVVVYRGAFWTEGNVTNVLLKDLKKIMGGFGYSYLYDLCLAK